MKIKPIYLIFLLIFIISIVIVLAVLARNEQVDQIALLNTQQAAVTQTDSRAQTATKAAANTQTQTFALQTEQNTGTPTPTSSPQAMFSATATSTNTPLGATSPTATATSAPPGVSTATLDSSDPTTVEPTSTAPVDDTLVPTEVLTTTPDADETEIVTPVDWTGNWTAFFGDEGGLLFRATLIVTRTGNTIIGMHSTQKFTGILSEDGLTVVGTWENPPLNGSFSWTIVDQNQFCGNTEKAFAYCAARSGATRPEPCFCLPPTDYVPATQD
jgi:hypothetical protein